MLLTTATSTPGALERFRAGTIDARCFDLMAPWLNPHRRYLSARSSFERVAALALLCIVWPLLLIAMLSVRLTSRGPALFRQTREGLRGKPFTRYKIRTMNLDAERNTGPVWSQPGDPRVTTLGALLRATHIDELPQLINVVRGEMSLIGPRPERPEIAHRLRMSMPHYNERLLILPGITGLAQVSQAADPDLSIVRNKLWLDTEYMRSADVWLDVEILLYTLAKVVGIYRAPGTSHSHDERDAEAERLTPTRREFLTC